MGRAGQGPTSAPSVHAPPGAKDRRPILMGILARPKSRPDGRWSYSCGDLVDKDVYCPGKVAIVEKVAGVWMARPPMRREWRKRDGRYISQLGHEPNRG